MGEHPHRGVDVAPNTTTASRMSLRKIPALVLACVSLAGFECVPQRNAEAYVALMAGQKARPLNGTFNNVPVLHSNQPEIVTGPGILVNTAAGSAIAAESEPAASQCRPHLQR